SVSRVGFLCDVATSAFYPLSLHDALPILCLTVVGIPFGIQCFKLAMLGLMPFGRRIVERPAATGCLATLMNIIWLLVGGLELARSEEHTSELQSRENLVCRLLLEKKNTTI